MAPDRASSSKSKKNTVSKTQKQGFRPYEKPAQQDASDLPGVQKLKAALRQTRRLLAKEILAADVRVETERRLKSLEADLEIAERRRKERAMAMRYHKVKFFERKKVLRKIKQVKKELASGVDGSKKATTKLENALFELRVDINYIQQYPKLEKYISLFPSSEQSLSDGGHTSKDVDDETSMRRQALRDLVRRKMESGELSVEPELAVERGERLELEGEGHPVSSGTSIATARDRSGSTSNSKKAIDRSTKRQKEDGKVRIAEGVEDDDFFDAASDSESEGQ